VVFVQQHLIMETGLLILIAGNFMKYTGLAASSPGGVPGYEVGRQKGRGGCTLRRGQLLL